MGNKDHSMEGYDPSKITGPPMKVHLFMLDDRVHAVTNTASHVKRDGTHRAICAKVITPEATRITPGHSVSCDICLRVTTALGDLSHA